MTVPHLVLNTELHWHNREQWNAGLELLRILFNRDDIHLSDVKRIAVELRAKIDAVDGFIQENTAEVCPDCKKVCCINKHGYYDYQDLIYVYALGLEPPAYKEGIADTKPCQFLGQYGCTIERSIRPFRCNWHFCSELINFMSAGPAKPLRSFNLQFQELQGLKQELIDKFFESLNQETEKV